MCKQGMQEWKQMQDVDELKKQILEFKDEVDQMQKILESEARQLELQKLAKKGQAKAKGPQ